MNFDMETEWWYAHVYLSNTPMMVNHFRRHSIPFRAHSWPKFDRNLDMYAFGCLLNDVRDMDLMTLVQRFRVFVHAFEVASIKLRLRRKMPTLVKG